MLKLLIRIALFAFCCTLLADAVLPPRTQELTIDRHSSSVSRHVGNGTIYDTSYTLHFAGGTPESCSVGYTAYGAVQDGDKVSVQSTKVIGNCIHIQTLSGEVVERNKYWRIWELAGAALALAVAVGWIEWNTDDRYRTI